MHILILAAVPEELGTLAGATVGVGPLRAAHRAGLLLAAHQPDAVLLVGTCGSYTTQRGVGEVVCSSVNHWASGVDVLRLGYTPLPPQPLESDPQLIESSGLPAVRVVTVPTITSDPALAERLGALGEVEHMEAYGVALAAQSVGVPFLAILGIANPVGPGAHEAWKRHRGTAEARARDAAGRLLQRLSPKDCT